MAAVFAAGPASAAPAATPPAAGTSPGAAFVGVDIIMAYTATDGTVWVRDIDTGVYTPAGGHLITGPGLVASGSSVIVFGVGTDHALWTTTCVPGAASCSGWTSLGGYLTSRPGAVFRGPSDADYSVYARGTNGAVWGLDHTTVGWGAWYTTGGNLYGGTGPAAAFISGHVWLLATGTDGGLYIQEVGVTGFSFTDGYSTASPGLAAISGALIGFARGTPDNAAYYHQFLASSPGWHYFGGVFTSGLAAASSPAVFTYTFGLGTDSRVYENNGRWVVYPPTFTGWLLAS
ncbi:MAG: hypothetical protein JO132_16780 [Streptosporangiaceae bacterium]|nr:hypothetical protein [Streptosporangiaceae bacterium]